MGGRQARPVGAMPVEGRLRLGPQLREVLARITEDAARLLGVEGAGLRLADGDELVRVATYGPEGAVMLRERLRLGESLSGRVAAAGRPLILGDSDDDPTRDPVYRDRARLHGFRSWLGVPLRDRERVVGVLVMQSRSEQRFGSDDVRLLEAFAGQAAVAIENARLLERERERRRQLEAVREVTVRLAGTTDLPALLQLISRLATELLGGPSVAVFLWDEVTRTLVPRAWHGFGEWFGELRIQLGEGVAGVVAQRGAGMIVDDYRSLPFAKPTILERSGARAVIGEPLLYEGELRGVITASLHEPDRPFSEQDRHVLALFAAQAAIAIQHARLHEARDRALAEAEAARRRLDELVASVPGVVWEAWGRPDEGLQRIDFVSNHVEAMLGYSAEEWLATPNFWLSIVHPEDRERAAREAAEIFAGRRPGSSEFRWLAKDGRALWVEARSAVLRDEAGEPIGMRGVTLDTTDRKRAEWAQRFLAEAGAVLASSLDYQVTIQRAADLVVPTLADWCTVYLLTEGGEIQRVAVAYADNVKAELAQALRRYPPSPGSPRSSVREAMRTGQPALIPDIPADYIEKIALDSEHLEIMRKLAFRSSLTVPLRIRGEGLGALAFFRDEASRRYDEVDLALAEDLAHRVAVAIDNARLYREAQRAIRLREEFLSIAAHELKTPITSLRGFAQVLLGQFDLRGGTDERVVRRALEVIEQQSDRLSRLVSQLLDTSRLEAGRLVLDRQPTNLARLVQEAAARAQVNTNRHTLVVHVPAEVPALVDPLRLEQVFTNLIDNAIKYSPNGGRIEVELARLAPERVRLMVRDRGIGIGPEARERIFDRFYQAHGSDHRSGLGLGLYISRQIVELHGGAIEAQFPPDGGTRFVVSLPTGAVDASAAAAVRLSS